MSDAGSDPTLEDLDAGYNLRARHPEFQRRLARWIEASGAAREALGPKVDLAYGDGPRDRLDLFPASGGGGGAAPLLCFIHGGYWQSLDKSVFGFVAPAFARAGIAVAVIGYPLAPEATMDEIVGRIAAALAWARRNAAGHGLDPDRIFAGGHSAGGHLTAMMLSEESGCGFLRGGCALSGIYDLEPIRRTYLNAALRLDEAAVLRNSPIGLTPLAGRPLLLAVGGGETRAFLRQQEVFAERCRRAGVGIEAVTLPGLDHFTLLDAFATAGTPLHRAVVALVTGAAAEANPHRWRIPP